MQSAALKNPAPAAKAERIPLYYRTDAHYIPDRFAGQPDALMAAGLLEGDLPGFEHAAVFFCPCGHAAMHADLSLLQNEEQARAVAVLLKGGVLRCFRCGASGGFSVEGGLRMVTVFRCSCGMEHAVRFRLRKPGGMGRRGGKNPWSEIDYPEFNSSRPMSRSCPSCGLKSAYHQMPHSRIMSTNLYVDRDARAVRLKSLIRSYTYIPYRGLSHPFLGRPKNTGVSFKAVPDGWRMFFYDQGEKGTYFINDVTMSGLDECLKYSGHGMDRERVREFLDEVCLMARGERLGSRTPAADWRGEIYGTLHGRVLLPVEGMPPGQLRGLARKDLMRLAASGAGTLRDVVSALSGTGKKSLVRAVGDGFRRHGGFFHWGSLTILKGVATELPNLVRAVSAHNAVMREASLRDYLPEFKGKVAGNEAQARFLKWLKSAKGEACVVRYLEALAGPEDDPKASGQDYGDGDTRASRVRTYADTLGMFRELRKSRVPLPAAGNWPGSTPVRVHDALARLSKVLEKARREEKARARLLPFAYKDGDRRLEGVAGGLEFRLPASASDLDEWADDHGHCVWCYDEGVAKGAFRIVGAFRAGGELAACIQVQKGKGSDSVVQCKGKFNRALGNEDMGAVLEWCGERGIKFVGA